MKKALLKVALAVAGLFVTTSASAEAYLSTEGWTITPCSEISDNNSGYAVSMIDGDLNTYWHSNWMSDTSTSSYHFFTIDLGEAQQFDGADYWRRQGNQNGQFYTGKIYVSNEPFAFADHAAVKAFYDNAENVAAGSFEWTYSTEDADAVRRCQFAETANGRYVLVVIASSGADSAGKHACCAEFKLYNSGVTSYTITCNFLYNEAIVATDKFIGATGTPYTFNAPRYYAAEPVSGVVGETDETIEVTCTGYDYPFVASTSVEEAAYQAVFMHASYGNIVLAYNAATDAVIGVEGASYTTIPDEAQFAFIGNLSEGFKVYNKAAGKALLKSGDSTVLAPIEEATVWRLEASESQAAEKYFTLRTPEGTGETCLNIQPVNGGWELKYWWQGDNGSTLWAYGLYQITIDTYTQYFNNAKATFADNEDVIAAADEALALLATLDPFVEIPAETIEALEAYKAAIDLKVLIAQKKAQIEVYFAASQEPSFYMDMLGQLDWCESAEEVEATYFDLLNTATMFMESSLELGCLWKNNETGLYATAQTVATGGFQYKLESEMSLNGYWVAEFIEDGNGGIAPANEDEQLPESGEEEGETDEEPVVETRKFYLRNVLTNTYVANNSTNLTMIAPTTNKNSAAVIELVIAPNGYKFIITNDNVENNFIGAASELIGLFQEAENALTYWSVPSLPMFNGTTQYIEMNFIGEYTEGDWTVDWHKINGVEIKVSKGATPTAIGNLTISHLDMSTWDQVTDAQFDMTTLLEGVTPTAEVIEDYDAGYYDPTIGEWGEWVENLIDVELDVYTVNFETPLTAYEYFTAVLSAGAFALTVDGETAYSFESYAEAEIKAPPMPFDVVITPVEGTVVELTEINVGCDKAIYANWNGWEAMTLVANGETTLFELYAGNMSDFAHWDFDDPDAPQFKIPVADAITLYYNKLIENAAEGEEITVPTYNPAAVGTYVLTVPTGFFTDDAENESNPLTVTWTIEETDGINTITNVTVNGNVIYDLQGRRVANPNKGIYIINGKKTLVK